MYSASLQNYNKYNRNRTLAVSFVFNIVIFSLFFLTTGSFFGSMLGKEKRQHTISIKSYNIVNQSLIPNVEPVKTPTQQDLEPQKPQEEVKKIPPKKEIEISDKGKKRIDKPKKNDTAKSTKTTNNDVKQQSSTPQSTQNAENSQIVTDATHFGMQNPPPEYPVIAFQNNENGSVTIEYVVSAEGLVKEAKVVESSGFPRLDRAALSSFKRWKFKPAIGVAGALVDSLPKRITFVFDIKTQTIKEE